jgi:4-amino-4-deoxy-L-arabinose transferase-like glycosyltransferase
VIPSKPERRNVLLDSFLAIVVCSAAAALLFEGLGRSSIFGDESIYASVAKGIAESHRWLLPEYRGELFMMKPPLEIWATALVFKMFGASEFTARVLDATFGVATTLVVFLYGRTFFGRTVGFVAALLLLTAKQLSSLHCFRDGSQDGALVLLLSGCVFLHALGLARRQESRWLVVACGVLLGAALLVKSLVALVVWPPMVAAHWLLTPKGLRQRGQRDLLVVLVVAMLIYLPWLILVVVASHGEYLQVMYIDLVVRALSTRQPPSTPEGPLFYVESIFRDFGVWILLLAGAALVLGPIRRRLGEGAAIAYIVAAVCSVGIVLLLSLPRSKLEWYVYPAYPGMAIVMAVHLNWIWRAVRKSVVLRSLLVAGVVVCLCGGLWVSRRHCQEVFTSDMQRFATYCRERGDVEVFVGDDLWDDPWGFREWNYYYASGIPGVRRVVPGDASLNEEGERCRCLITSNPERYLTARTLASSRTVRIAKHDPREKDVFVVEVGSCGERGFFER